MHESPDHARADEAYRKRLAQSFWPQPTQHWLAVYPDPSRPTSPQAPGKKPPSVWRAIRIGAVGLIAGLFAAFVLQDLVGMAFVLIGSEYPLGIAAVIGALMPVFAAAGVVVALLLDRKTRKRQPGAGASDRHNM